MLLGARVPQKNYDRKKSLFANRPRPQKMTWITMRNHLTIRPTGNHLHSDKRSGVNGSLLKSPNGNFKTTDRIKMATMMTKIKMASWMTGPSLAIVEIKKATILQINQQLSPRK